MWHKLYHMYFAYLSAGNILPDNIEMNKLQPLEHFANFYKFNIYFNLQNYKDCIISDRVTFNGITYCSGQWDFVDVDYDENITIGKIIVPIVSKSNAIHFFLDIHDAKYERYTGLIAIDHFEEQKRIVNLKNLLHFYPLSSYFIKRKQYVALKHAIIGIPL